MLLTDFYTLTSFRQASETAYEAYILLNKAHAIFKGHFPGNPVTPGVCMMQIIKDLTEQITQQSLFLTRSSNVKFMALINPEENPDLRLELDVRLDDNGHYKVKNVTSFSDTVALKLTNIYKINVQ